MDDWNETARVPKWAQATASRWLLALAIGTVLAGIIAGGVADSGGWLWVGYGLGSALPLLVLARVFDYLSFIAARIKVASDLATDAEERRRRSA